MSFSNSILTYHSQNIRGDSTHNNDHVALKNDLDALHASGLEVISLDRLLDRLEGRHQTPDLKNTVCLTFDDGCDFDVQDIEYPEYGMQRSFAGILDDFVEQHGTAAQPGLHATSFVIASNQARRIIDRRSLYGKGWISDDWWQACSGVGLISVGNHGWDHNHPDLAIQDKADGAPTTSDQARGDFYSIDTLEQCQVQVLQAADFIEDKSGIRPKFFAYPFGESSAFLRQSFFANPEVNHGCRAALGTDPGKVSEASNRWNLPRFVCGRDWQTPEQLLSILE
jgi:peptidoglycan/xylan/chitin deacetylase (PgdA/CDA1 family)